MTRRVHTHLSFRDSLRVLEALKPYADDCNSGVHTQESIGEIIGTKLGLKVTPSMIRRISPEAEIFWTRRRKGVRNADFEARLSRIEDAIIELASISVSSNHLDKIIDILTIPSDGD